MKKKVSKSEFKDLLVNLWDGIVYIFDCILEWIIPVLVCVAAVAVLVIAIGAGTNKMGEKTENKLLTDIKTYAVIRIDGVDYETSDIESIEDIYYEGHHSIKITLKDGSIISCLTDDYGLFNEDSKYV